MKEMTIIIFVGFLLLFSTFAASVTKSAELNQSTQKNTTNTSCQVVHPCQSSLGDMGYEARESLRSDKNINERNEEVEENLNKKFSHTLVNLKKEPISKDTSRQKRKVNTPFKYRRVFSRFSTPKQQSNIHISEALPEKVVLDRTHDNEETHKLLHKREVEQKMARNMAAFPNMRTLLSDLFNEQQNRHNALGTIVDEGIFKNTPASQTFNGLFLNLDDDLSMAKKTNPTKSSQQIDVDVEESLDLLKFYMDIEHLEGYSKLNKTSFGEKQSTYRNRSIRDKIKNILQNNPKIYNKQYVDGEKHTKDSYSKIVQDFLSRSPEDGLPLEFSNEILADYFPGHDNERNISKRPIEMLSLNPDRQNILLPSVESCRHVFEARILSLPGCLPKSIIITRCIGECDSRAIPDWIDEGQFLRIGQQCSCCSALVVKYRTLRFQCPVTVEGVWELTIGFPFRCMCRPCSIVPEVEAEQPYDY